MEAHGGQVDCRARLAQAAASGCCSHLDNDVGHDMPKVLLVEDEEALARGLEFNLGERDSKWFEPGVAIPPST